MSTDYIANISLSLSFVAALAFGLIQIRGSARDRRERLTIDTKGRESDVLGGAFRAGNEIHEPLGRLLPDAVACPE